MATTNRDAARHRAGLTSGKCPTIGELQTPTGPRAPTEPYGYGECPAPTGWQRHRTRQRALAAAATAAAMEPGDQGGNPRWPTDTAAFEGLADLVRAAQEEWWREVLARVDAGLDDDLAAMAPGARYQVIRDAWSAQVREDPGYLKLAAMGAGDDGHATTGRRYARLLALFSGRADVEDDIERAADAGLDLVRELSASRRVITAVA